jgi:hypothetical protein
MGDRGGAIYMTAFAWMPCRTKAWVSTLFPPYMMCCLSPLFLKPLWEYEQKENIEIIPHVSTSPIQLEFFMSDDLAVSPLFYNKSTIDMWWLRLSPARLLARCYLSQMM